MTVALVLAAAVVGNAVTAYYWACYVPRRSPPLVPFSVTRSAWSAQFNPEGMEAR